MYVAKGNCYMRDQYAHTLMHALMLKRGGRNAQDKT